MTLEERLKILVVEDSDIMRKYIGQGLRVLGYTQVTSVSNGETAVNFLETNRMDLIISDWYMEPGSGLDLARWVRSNSEHSETIFIMLSGETAKEKVLEAVKSGVDAYIIKPFTVNSLGIKIHEMLKKKKII